MSQSAREKNLHVPASLHSSQSVQYMYTLLVVDIFDQNPSLPSEESVEKAAESALAAIKDSAKQKKTVANQTDV